MKIPIDLDVTCFTCPLVIEGTVAGLEVFYRARHGRWRVESSGSQLDAAGTCTTAQEGSVRFAMAKIFGVPAVKEAIGGYANKEMDREYEGS